MPIVKFGRNNFAFEYKIPKRKKNLMTNEFLQTFKNELDNICNKISGFDTLKTRNYWNTYQYLESSCGFYEALNLACKKHNLTKAIYKYASKMPYYDSDIFDSEMTLLMVERGIIDEGNIDEFDEESYYENNKDYKLEITKTKLKDCTIIHKNWILTEECKKRLNIN